MELWLGAIFSNPCARIGVSNSPINDIAWIILHCFACYLHTEDKADLEFHNFSWDDLFTVDFAHSTTLRVRVSPVFVDANCWSVPDWRKQCPSNRWISEWEFRFDANGWVLISNSKIRHRIVKLTFFSKGLIVWFVSRQWWAIFQNLFFATAMMFSTFLIYATCISFKFKMHSWVTASILCRKLLYHAEITYC